MTMKTGPYQQFVLFVIVFIGAFLPYRARLSSSNRRRRRKTSVEHSDGTISIGGEPRPSR